MSFVAFISQAFLLVAASAVRIEIINKCPYTIWPGITDMDRSSAPAGGGFRLASNHRKVVYVPVAWKDGFIWARTGCDRNFSCETGSCENNERCAGLFGERPVSLVVFNLNVDGKDTYFVSLMTGYNLPVSIEPIHGTYDGEFPCKLAGGCLRDLNELCPTDLQVRSNGRVVGCMTACDTFGQDEFCCAGEYDVVCGPTVYSRIFKNACPNAVSHRYDDSSLTMTCHGLRSPSPDYRVEFC